MFYTVIGTFNALLLFASTLCWNAGIHDTRAMPDFEGMLTDVAYGMASYAPAAKDFEPQRSGWAALGFGKADTHKFDGNGQAIR